MNMVKKCYIYTRVSTSMQIDGFSLDAQRHKLMKYAEAMDMQVIREYSDEGRSGKNIKDRPQFVQMLKDIEKDRDGVCYVLVFKLSRFGRNAADVLSSLQTMQDNGVNLIAVEDSLDSSKDAGKLMITVLAAVAEMERDNIRVQTMSGRKEKAYSGLWNGGAAPYGYSLVNGKLVVVEDEAEAIRIIFDKYVNTDLGYTGVAKYLAKCGISKVIRHNGKLAHFSEDFVKNVLDNEVYMGKIAYGKRKTQTKKGTRGEYEMVKNDDYILVDGVHEAIVTEELWSLAHKKRKATAIRLSKKHDLEHEHLLSGIVKCPHCGKGLVGNVNRKKKKNGEPYPTHFFYHCNKSKKAGGYACDYRRQWTESDIDNAVVEEIKSMVANERFATAIQKIIDDKLDTRELEHQLESAQKEQKRIERLKDSLISQIDSLDNMSSTYELKFDDLQGRLDTCYLKMKEARDEVQDCENRLEQIKKNKVLKESVYQYLLMFDKVYELMTDLEKKMFFNNFISEVQIFGEAQKGERILKSIDFKMPIYYDGCETTHIGWDEKDSVESVVLMSRVK